MREIARTQGFINHAKKDSTGICFIGERKFKQFLNDYLPAKPGIIETIDGETIGQHDGLMFYTIGQRQGLNIGGQKGKAESPWYVAYKDLGRNVLVVVQGEHPALYRNELIVGAIHWINDVSFTGSRGHPEEARSAVSKDAGQQRLTAKIRYRQTDQPCRLIQVNDQSYRVIFDQPQRAVTPGQSIVFYHDDICLGGGIIEG